MKSQEENEKFSKKLRRRGRFGGAGSICIFNQAYHAQGKIAGGRALHAISITAQHTQQARLVRVNLRRYLYAVAGFVAVAAEVRRVCGDRPVAFVGVLIRAATAKGLSTGFTTPGELAGAGAGRPGCAVGLAGHQTTTLSPAPATGTQNEAISAALAISTFIRSNITERENAGYFRESMG